MTFDERDILLKAASLVEQGWCQNVAWKYEEGFLPRVHRIGGIFSSREWQEARERITHVCAVGAIRVARADLTGEIPHSNLPTALELAAQKRLTRVISSSVIGWNDTPGRTQEQVAEALRKAAE